MSDTKNFWSINKKEFENRFLGILAEYQDSIQLMTGGHIHQMEFRSAYSYDYTSLNIPLIASPSVTPIYNNQPSFTTFTLKKK